MLYCSHNYTRFFFPVSWYEPLLVVNWRIYNPQIIIFLKYEIVPFISTSLAVSVELGRDCQLLSCRCVAAGALRLQVAAPHAGESHNYCNFHNMQLFAPESWRRSCSTLDRPPTVERGVISSVSGSSSQPEACREVKEETSEMPPGFSSPSWGFYWDGGVILYFLWLPAGTNALACPSSLPLYVPSAYESVCERESLRVGGREPHMWVTLSPSGSLHRL